MGKFRTLRTFAKSVFTHYSTHNASFGYIGNRGIGQLTGASRRNLFRANSHATGSYTEDDYEVDMSEEVFSYVKDYMRGECANAGQESLVETAINEAEYRFTKAEDFRPHSGEPDFERGESYLVLSTYHPEAIGEIINNAYNVWDTKCKQYSETGGF